MTALRAALDAAFAALPAAVARPGTGAAACRGLADIYDLELAARFTAAAADEPRALALVATGGWARRELAPYSDIDLIVLHGGYPAAAKRVADRLLYPLWDDKLAVGHAVREPREAAALARDDVATATALLDARHIAGVRALTDDLTRRTLAALAPGGNPNELIAALAEGNRARHERFGASIYLLEPNLKQGIGALRDLATALWAAGIRWCPPRPDAEPLTGAALIAELVARGLLTRRQADALSSAHDFQLRLRMLVQLGAGRRFDQLTFELQESIARELPPYADAVESPGARAAVAPAVEALMRDYYLHARGVVQVADRLLDSARVPARGKPKLVRIDDSFATRDGELAVADPQVFAAGPAEIVRLFRVAVEQQLPIAGDTRDQVAEAVARAPAALAADSAAPALLRDALLDLDDRAVPAALETMHELGVLAALVPEWAPCTARVQHDLYHVYTVDQHQLYAVAMQKQLARGELVAEHPTATELWRSVTRPGPLLLATLLHDVGKPLGKGHAESGAVIADAVARRLGMSAADAELAAFLVRQHLTMSHLSQRRDLGDPEVIARFAARVGDAEQLVLLYLLTVCDAAMTAPDNLTAWKAGLLLELLQRTLAQLGDPRAAEPAADARAKVAALLDGDAAFAALVDGIDRRLAAQLTPRQTARAVRLLARARDRQPSVALEVHCFPLKGHSEVAIVAPDAPGVLAAIAGALTASRVDVLGAVLGHADLPGGRLALDTFYVRDGKGAAITEADPRWARLDSDLAALFAAAAPARDQVTALIARRRPPSTLPPRITPSVATEIRLSDDSAQATIVEVFTRDRAGVLHAITHALADAGLDISLAKISTEGEKVADVFYVSKLPDPAARAALVDALHAALGADELA